MGTPKPLHWHNEKRVISSITLWDINPRQISDKDRIELSKSLKKFDYVEPIIINLDNKLIGGHQRISQLIAQGKKDEEIDVRVPNRELTKEEFKELALRLNRNRGQWDEEKLAEFFTMEELTEYGFSTAELEDVFKELANQEETDFISQSLQEKFIVPPFSILDTRQGYWQDRKKHWHSLFDSQESREEVELIAKSGQSPAIYELRNKMRKMLKREPEWDEIIAHAKEKGLHIYEGASIFDPVLAEVCYRWFCPAGGKILDPFAGGSVRGIVAGMSGFSYYGIDLRQEQCQANQRQLEKILPADKEKQKHYNVGWEVGDSNIALDHYDRDFDFIFSCPPYHDLEKYCDDPADLSNMSYEDFISVYRSIITKAMAKLKPNRFACFVVGEIRDKKGNYRNFVGDTIDCFSKCIDENGQHVMYYNEIILINVAGSLPVRVGRQFEAGRKVGKMHQNVLVFYKGDPKKIKEEFPKINIEKDLQELNYQPNIALSVID